MLDTPGHTPEHISYVVVDHARGPEPVVVFCGDTLFVGDVGRPDLFPGIARELASKLYDSLHGKLLQLPDFCEVLPAHGAGSLCGRAMGAKRSSTIGTERRYNSALQITDREAFIASLTTHMPAAPDHFSRCSAINGHGPALVSSLPALQPAPPSVFRALAARDSTIALDTRSYEAFGGLLFGVGFGVLGYCPGTAAAAVGHGTVDALVGAVGMLIGAGIFASLYGRLRTGILARGDFGDLTFPRLLKVNEWVVVTPVAVMVGALLWWVNTL